MPAAIEWAPVIDQIIAAIATTPKSLNTICSEIDAAPTAKTFYLWMQSDEKLSERYARAKQDQLQVLADQIVDLADTDRIYEKVTIKPDGSRETVLLDQVERTKVQIDSRKWLLAKLNPKKYGERIQHEGEIGIKTVIVPATVKTDAARPAASPSFDEE